jgi:hypothetical protein
MLQADPGANKHWVDHVQYTMCDNGTPFCTVPVNQGTGAPNNHGFYAGNYYWTDLGQHTIPTGHTLSVDLSAGIRDLNDPYDDPVDGCLWADAVMIHFLWPTLTIRGGQSDQPYTEKDDWLQSWQPISVPVEGDGNDRVAVELSASIDTHYGSVSDWQAVLPSVAGLEFWTAASGGAQLPVVGSGNPIDQALTAGLYTGTVYVSEDPSFAATQGEGGATLQQIAFHAEIVSPETGDPSGADVSVDLDASLAYWTRDDWAASPAIDPKTGKAIIVYKGTATAHGTADLKVLAKDITNHPEDWTLVSNRSPSPLVPDGTDINIAPLLSELESRTRDAVVAAALVRPKNMDFGTSPAAGSCKGFTQNDVDAVFSGASSGTENLPKADCQDMVALELSEGLIKQLNPREFDQLESPDWAGDGFRPGYLIMPGSDPLLISQTAPISALPTGEWVTFYNPVITYVKLHPGGWFDCENTIEVTNNNSVLYSYLAPTFYGWTRNNGKILTEYEWDRLLRDEYNKGIWSWQKITMTDVPGYEGTGVFLNLATIGMSIFDLRTKPKSAS